MLPSGGFEVVPAEVAAERASIARLADATHTAHGGLMAARGAGSAIGHSGAEAAFESMVDAWRNVANQLAASIHEFAEATGAAASMYTEADAGSIQVQPTAAPEGSDTPVLWGP